MALLGWLKPLNDVSMITRLEPIIFVIIGYYFGRLPAQQNESAALTSAAPATSAAKLQKTFTRQADRSKKAVCVTQWVRR